MGARFRSLFDRTIDFEIDFDFDSDSHTFFPFIERGWK